MVTSPCHSGRRPRIRGLEAVSVGHHGTGHGQSFSATRPVALAAPASRTCRPRVDCMRYPVKRTVGDTVEVHATVVADGHVQVRAELRYRLVGARRWERVPMRSRTTSPTGSSPRSGSTSPVGGSSPSARGSMPPPRGATSCAARSMPARPISTAELSEGARAARHRRPRSAAGLASTTEVRVAKVSLGAPVDRGRRADPGRVRRVVRAVPAVVRRVRRRAPRCCPRSPISASTSCTSRRSTRSAPPTGRGATTSSRRRPTIPAARGRSVRPEGGHTQSTPSWARSTTSTASWRARGELGLEIALDFAVQASPDHPWLQKHPEWFSLAARRLDQVRREPTQALPGHRQLRLRRPGCASSCGRRCSAWSSTGSTTASACSASTTRTPSPSRSGSG